MAFGIRLSSDEISVEGITGLSTSRAKAAAERGNVIRLIAQCTRTSDGFDACVLPVELTASHPLALSTGAENCLILETSNGETVSVRGRGAGRWPTTEAVVADLFDLYRKTTPSVQRYAVATVANAFTEVYA